MDIYCFIEHSNKQLTGNIPKMALAVVTLLFNIILIVQHYILYMGNKIPELQHQPVDSERQGLINDREVKGYCSINASVDADRGLHDKVRDPEELPYICYTGTCRWPG